MDKQKIISIAGLFAGIIVLGVLGWVFRKQMVDYTVPTDEGPWLGVSYTLDQSETSASNNEQGMRTAETKLQLAQTFIPSVNGDVGKVTIKLRKNGSPTGNVWVEVRSDTAGQPVTLIKQSPNLDVSTVSTTATFYDFTFSAGGTLSSGATYWIILNGDYTVSASNFVWLSGKYPDGAYTNGTAYKSNAGVYSEIAAGLDFTFSEYYIAADVTTVKSANIINFSEN